MPEQKIIFDQSVPEILCLKLSGLWLITEQLPEAATVVTRIAGLKNIRQLAFETSGIIRWDSALVAFLFRLFKECKDKHIKIDPQRLPPGVQALLGLASQAEENSSGQIDEAGSFFTEVADRVIRLTGGALSLLNFLGQITVAFIRLIRGKVYFRRDDFMFILQRSGADALFLVSLISILVGIILAFIGATQLKLFGAQIYIANIVGIGMVRVMGAMMTAVLMAGRTGAAFAAELGLMQTNEEIDALQTLGVSPVEFLVIPRILALVVMMPLLTLYADLMGILGGFIMSISLLGLNPVEYWQHTQSSVTLVNLWVGLIHSFVFGIIIAVAGCFRGMQCSRSAAAVGEATTQAVVSAIISIVFATAVITFVCQVLGV
jgi:phospholipid/cholesterol/gamma-HCH transport system permease protein